MELPRSPALSRRDWLAASLGAGLVAGGLTARAAAPGTVPAAGGANDRGARVFNIRAFGATGDGVTLDTAAVQGAIDACHADGGGTVLVPAGIFIIGTVELKSQVTLHLAAQGKLLGSGDGRHYHAAAAIPTSGEWTMGDGNVGLIFAAHAEAITIEGQGTIDGNGAQFHSATRGATPPSGIGGNRRPHHILLYRCTNVVIRDVFLVASAYHSVRVCVCTRVKIDGVRISSRVNGNNDGFHFISCQYVHVSNCDVQCQDDACALFGSCRFVTVTNCTFSTRWSVFRFGGGEAEDIVVSNCVIHGTWGCPIKLRCSSQSRYENMSFSNLVFQDVTGPISIGLGPQRLAPAGAPAAPPGIVRNISFRGIRATVAKPVPLPDTTIGGSYNPGEIFSCIILNGMDAGFLENISFDDVHVTFPGGGTAEHAAVRDVPKIAGEYYAIGVPPAYGLFARNVRGLTLNNVRFEMAAPDLRPAVILDHVADATLNALAAQAQPDTESALRLIGCRDIFLAAPRLLSPTGVFLQTEGGDGGAITIDGGDVAKATRIVAAKNGADEASVKIRT